ncbi:MAG: hypothetical protein EBQ96_04375 [Proteobacteria bacterium]|nr:hypothetical protein [Pseudomonadota bacterium]
MWRRHTTIGTTIALVFIAAPLAGIFFGGMVGNFSGSTTTGFVIGGIILILFVWMFLKDNKKFSWFRKDN